MTRLILSVDSVTNLPPERTVAALRIALGAQGLSGGQLPQAGVTYDFLSPAAQWFITVPLTFKRAPTVSVFATDGTAVIADIVSTSSQVTVTFAAPFAGHVNLT